MDYSPLGRKQYKTIPLLGGVRGGYHFPVPHFHEDKFHEDKGCEISMNISRSYCLTHPLYPLPRGDFLSSGVNVF